MNVSPELQRARDKEFTLRILHDLRAACTCSTNHLKYGCALEVAYRDVEEYYAAESVEEVVNSPSKPPSGCCRENSSAES